MSTSLGSIRIVEMPDIGVVTDDSSFVGEHAGSGRFNALALRTYVDPRVVNVMTYGAKGDGVTDDGAAFTLALELVAGGGNVVVPAGTYNIGHALSQAITGAVSFVGAGSGVTILNFINPTDGLAFLLSSTSDSTVHVRGITIARVVAGAPYAHTGLSIAINGVQPPQRGYPTIEDIVLMGNTARTTAWNVGVSIQNASAASLKEIFVSMPDCDGSGTGTGVSLVGLSASSYQVETMLYRVETQGGSVGLLIGTWIQGVYVTNCAFIGNDYGIKWPGVSGHSDIALMLTNTHCNSTTRCFYSTNATGLLLSNMIILHFGRPSLTGDWAAYEIVYGAGCTLSNNNILGSGGPGTENGFVLTGGNTTTITGNTVAEITGHVVLINDMNDTTIVGNQCYAPGAAGMVSITGYGNMLQLGNQFNGNADCTIDAAGNIACFGGASLGGSVRANGDIYAQGNLTLDGYSHRFGLNGSTTGTDTHVIVNGGPGFNRVIEFSSNTLGRWFIGADNTPETGSDAGSDFSIISGADSGSTLIGNPLRIKRSTGVVTFGSSPTFGSPITDAANDAAAATAGVPVGGLYRSGSALQVRVS